MRWGSENRRKTPGGVCCCVGVDAMKYAVSLQCEDGEYVAECAEMNLTARSLSPGNALDALREEIRYRLELCPCTSVDEDYIEFEVRG